MVLETIDWIIIISFFILSLIIGIYASKSAGKSAKDFFLSGRNMPWWLLGVSMVATTFSCDTPNLVTDIVRKNGVAGNWAWWAFLLTGMLTVFVYAKLWRRSKVLTDLEFYEIRYGGKMAAFLRGFRALYLGVFFNIMVIASVALALIKIGAVILHWSPLQTVLIASTITVIYSSLGGLKGILLTDFFQFIIALIGAFGAAIIILNLPEINGLEGLLNHPKVNTKIDLLPDFNDFDAVLTLLILPIAIQWWSVWYPGAEPGGGGYIAQRMLSAKNESGAIKATLFFNFAHYAIRPWPWIIVALASIVIFPDLDSIAKVFPDIDKSIIQDDIAYPAMLTYLPNGFLGIVIASLLAAFMSTTSTQLNWGASYIVNDFYLRFINSKASEKQLVLVGRISTILLMLAAALFALLLKNAFQAFNILLQIGAGTGLIFILRWFWWRINAYSEISAMVSSFFVAIYLELIHPMTSLPELGTGVKLVLGVFITSFVWITVTLLTKAENKNTLINFYKLIKPGGPGWKKLIVDAKKDGIELQTSDSWDVPTGVLSMILGSFAIYGALFATGNWIYGNYIIASILTVISILTTYLLSRTWKKLKIES